MYSCTKNGYVPTWEARLRRTLCCERTTSRLPGGISKKTILVWNPAEIKLKEACSKIKEMQSVEKFGSKRKSSCFVCFDSIRYPHFKRSWRYTNWVQNAVCRPNVSLQRGLGRWSTNEKHFSAVQINKSPLRSKSFTSTPKSLTQKLNL